MKEIVFDSFKSTLKEVQFLNAIIKNEKAKKKELQEGLLKARDLLFSSYSSLNIFDEAVKNYISVGYGVNFGKKEKNKISKTEAKVIYSKLIDLIGIEVEGKIIVPKTVIHFKYESEILTLYLHSPHISQVTRDFDNALEVSGLKIEEIKTIILKYFNEIVNFLQEILLYNIFLIFDKPKITSEYKTISIRDYKKEYIDSWVNCSVEIDNIIRNARVDYWDEIYDLKLDHDHIERIEKHQEKLFYQRVGSEVRIAFSDISELTKSHKILQIEKELTLIYGFFNGDLSKLTVKRLNELISFSKAKKVILAYDDLKRNIYYNANKYLIYVNSRPRMYSNYFVASFFIGYIKELEDELGGIESDEIIVQLDSNLSKTRTKPKHQSFTYINNITGQSNLTSLKDSLIRKKLIASDTDLKDFRKVFGGEAIEKPIVWTGNISELSYFIKQLHNVLKYVVDLKQQQWVVTINCFIQEDGKLYNRTKLRAPKIPTTSKIIDKALKNLK
ncbi:hypothetical protein ES044_16105 [Polaribacter sp. IC066]|uniref:hypothetical protein n=1 Tax=Polaribacter sp. IC066 TaxID=57032 RepID=UPI0011BE1827|nr:hypothetical protein [Polaribacter sp. IC066]TXD56915.1 hypothetical protein ES044_16105 [Polaribacter sp. IC066]